MPTKRFPVEYAILGIIAEGPAHGYVLRKRLDAALGPFWNIATSQIYSALHSMADEGLVTVEVQEQAGRPPRNVYLATERGTRALFQWCVAPVRHLRDIRVVFMAKLYFLHHSSSNAVLTLIDAQAALLDRLLARVSQRKDLPTDDKTLAHLAIRFRVRQIRAAIDWLEECKRWILENEKGDTDEVQLA
jgi:PadR family transcriptional regulator, regulatory protein AphA